MAVTAYPDGRVQFRTKGKSAGAKRKYSHASLTAKRRAKVKERDGFRCVTCGSTADLEVDHIIPVAKGGTRAMDNLQTLCGGCNYFKADRLL